MLLSVLLGGCLHAASIALGTNAIVNADAESGAGSADGAIVPVPGWTVTGNFTAVQYGAVDASGAFPAPTDPGPASRGANFFAGGPGNSFSSATQLLDVSNISAQIDAGIVTFLLSGYLGGFATQGDYAVLTADFLDASSASLGSAAIGPVTSSDRSNSTGLLPRDTNGAIPVGTRGISFTLDMTRLAGSYNDGYADNLSFIARAPSGVPEPGTIGMIVLGLGAVVWFRRR
jgi:hypothetical protein